MKEQKATHPQPHEQLLMRWIVGGTMREGGGVEGREDNNNEGGR